MNAAVMLGSFAPVVVRTQASSTDNCTVGAASGMGAAPLEQPTTSVEATNTATIASSLRMPHPSSGSDHCVPPGRAAQAHDHAVSLALCEPQRTRVRQWCWPTSATPICATPTTRWCAAFLTRGLT